MGQGGGEDTNMVIPSACGGGGKKNLEPSFACVKVLAFSSDLIKKAETGDIGKGRFVQPFAGADLTGRLLFQVDLAPALEAAELGKLSS